MAFYYSTMDANKDNTLRVPQAKLTNAADGVEVEKDIEEQEDGSNNADTPEPKRNSRGRVAGNIKNLKKLIQCVGSNTKDFETVLAGATENMRKLSLFVETDPANACLAITDSDVAIEYLFDIYPTVQSLLVDARSRDSQIGNELQALHVSITKLLVAVVSSNNSRNNEIRALALVTNCPNTTFDRVVAGFEALVVGGDGIFTTAVMFFLKTAYYIPAEEKKLMKLLEIVETLIGKMDFEERLRFSDFGRYGGNGDEALSILQNKYYTRSNYQEGNNMVTSIVYGDALKKVLKIKSVLNAI